MNTLLNKSENNVTPVKQISSFLVLDKTFNESMFITKVNNIFIQLFSSIMLDELDNVKHFISDEIFNYANEIVLKNKNNGTRQMYDELNVKNSSIHSIEVNENVYTIKVYLQSRYMDYIISLDDGSRVSGNDDSRIQVDYMLTFEKKVDFINQGVTRKCPGCGAPMNINESGKCSYCEAIYNQYDYDWILTKLEVLN